MARVPLTAREKREKKRQLALAREHIAATADPEYRARVEQARAKAVARTFRVPLTEREKQERDIQLALLHQHRAAVEDPGYRRQVERARAEAERRWLRTHTPTQEQLASAEAQFERELREHYERLISISVAEFRERVKAVKPKDMSAREFQAKIRAWPTLDAVAKELATDVATVRKWKKSGVPGARASEVRAEHARRVELVRIQREYIAVGTQVLHKRRSESPVWPGKRKYSSRQRLGVQWHSTPESELLDPQKLHTLESRLKKLRGPGKLWQATAMLVLVVPEGLVDDIRYAGAGTAMYARILQVPKTQSGLELVGMYNVPVQTAVGPKEAVLEELRSGILEAIDLYGSVLVDTISLTSFNWTQHAH